MKVVTIRIYDKCKKRKGPSAAAKGIGKLTANEIEHCLDLFGVAISALEDKKQRKEQICLKTKKEDSPTIRLEASYSAK